MHPRTIYFFLLVIISACAAGCSSSVDRNTNTAPVANVTNRAATVEEFRNSDKEKDTGDFVVEHRDTAVARFKPYEQRFREDKIFEKAADKLNGALKLPYDIVIRTKDCNETNALYDSADKSITICYELPEHFHKLFRNKGYSETEAREKVLDTVRFAFLHELGHALIEAYQIPLTGNEEDAADRLSGFICLEEMGEQGKKAVIAAAEAFKLEAENDGRPDLSDEHLSEKQRFYTTLCLLYGSDPERYADLIKKDYLPAARADRCPNEYRKTVQSWSELLSARRKD